jgi:hypothetical protein
MGIGKKICYTLLLFAVTGLSPCKHSRTPSKERFEKNSRIKIPEDAQVLKDEYYDMPPDYAIIYDLKIPQNAMTGLIKNIKRSGLYHITVASKRSLDKDEFQIDKAAPGVWKQTESGYTFSKDEGKTQYRIEIDTSKRTFTAWEGYAGGLVLK